MRTILLWLFIIPLKIIIPPQEHKCDRGWMMIISEPTLYSSSPHQNYSTAISPMTMAIIQMRQPHDVEQPSPRKSNIHPRMFNPHPRMLNAKSPMTTIAMIPIVSMHLNLISSRLRRVLPVAFLADVPSLFVLSLS